MKRLAPLSLLALAAGLASVLVAPPAYAQKKGKVTELGEIVITGRVQKPVAAVDITRLSPKLSLAELRQPFIDRIEQAIYSDPF
jgi:hypothetical protein